MGDSDVLHPLPPQPSGVPWPTDYWPRGSPPAALEAVVDEVFGDAERFGTTYAVVVVQGGRLLLDRYGGALPHFDRPSTPVEPDTPLLSWSMAKSVLHATVGVLVGDGRLRLDEPPGVSGWDDGRAAITLDQLLQMRDGLAWNEDYVDAGASDVIEMLFGAGQDDVAAYAEARPLAHEPGTVFNYSSGTSNVIAAIVGRTVGGGDAVRRFVLDRVLHPIGMRSADPRIDEAGTFVGSSYVYAAAQDWARFGTLYLRDGVWDGRRLLPEGWVDHGRRVRSVDESDGGLYGAHWWIDQLDTARGTFRASGYEGQMVAICPPLDAIVVRLGSTPEAIVPNLPPWRKRVLDALE
ncbi:MAG: serine hydrolase domain-containing protein [Acidimicrobiales bacterium]